MINVHMANSCMASILDLIVDFLQKKINLQRKNHFYITCLRKDVSNLYLICTYLLKLILPCVRCCDLYLQPSSVKTTNLPLTQHPVPRDVVEIDKEEVCSIQDTDVYSNSA